MTMKEILIIIIENIIWIPIGAIGTLIVYHIIAFLKRKNVMFIIAEASMGKTILTRYIVYRLKLKSLHKNSDGIFDSEEVYYNRFSEILDIDTVTNHIGSGEYKYIILDGFDEFPLLNEKDASELLEELISKISTHSSKYKKLIITSRLGYIRHGERSIKRASIIKENFRGEYQYKKADILRLNYLNKKQIKKVYSFHTSLEKILIINRIRSCRKRNKYLRRVDINNCIFRNPFFVTYANDLPNSFTINELSAIKQEDIFFRNY